MKRKLNFFLASLVACLCIAGICLAEDDAGNVPVGILKLPDNISIELINPERGMLMLSEENGQVQLPQGQYRLESWTLEKKDDKGRTWKLSGDVNTARMVDVGPEPTTLEIKTEPIVCDLKINPYDNAMNFTLGLKGPSGERLRVSGDAPGVKSDQLPQPTFVLYTADRSFEKSHKFQSQCCGNFRYGWKPPPDVQGPFFVDIKVAGPFEIDFTPVNLSEIHEAKIAEQQVARKKEIRLYCLIGCCYAVVLAIVIGILIKCRKRIVMEGPEGRSKRVIKRLTLLLGVFVLLMILNPLSSLLTKDCGFIEVIAESGLMGGLLLVGTLLVWGVRKVRTKWPFLTIMLYGIIFVLLFIPVMFAVFLAGGNTDTDITDIGLAEFADFYGMLFSLDELGVFIVWAIILAIFIAQASLMIVPVRIKHQRPKKRRGIWWTAIVAALLYTVLLFFVGLSIMAVVWGDDFSEPVFWVLVGILPLNWIGWSVVFCLFSRNMEPKSNIRRLMRWLIGGSILELLIAVPSHIIIRHRDVCCAHGFTAAGLTTGLAVIFLAFGPGLYFLYADRIRSKRPNLTEQAEEPTPETLPQG